MGYTIPKPMYGPCGISGITGTIGPVGIPGKSGTSGTVGVSGKSGSVDNIKIFTYDIVADPAMDTRLKWMIDYAKSNMPVRKNLTIPSIEEYLKEQNEYEHDSI